MADILMNVFLVFMCFSMFNFIRYMLKVRKLMKQHKDNPNVKGISIVNGEVKIIEDTPKEQAEVPKELFIDPICGEEVDKKDAYRILKDGKEYFFCSWDCRQKFLKESV